MIPPDPIIADAPPIGSEKVFRPQALFISEGSLVTGTCVYVNTDHRFARYQYISPGAGDAWECFKY